MGLVHIGSSALITYKILVKQKLKLRSESALKVLHFALPHEPRVS